MANLFWISAAQVAKDLGDGPFTAASVLTRYGWTFARADGSTCATYIDKNGIVQTAAANLLRLQYEDLNGDGIRETPGFLLEGSRTNSCLRSQELDNAAWTRNLLTGVTADAAVAPDGTTTADLIIPDTSSSNQHYIQQSFTITANENIAFSGRFKASGYTAIHLLLTDGVANNITKRYDFAGSGALGNSGTLGAGTISLASITAEANGYFRVTLSGNIGGGATAITLRIILYDNITDANSSTAYAGNGTSGIVVWGAQLERASAFPSSYIKTVASTVTRAADSLTLPVPFGVQDLTVYARVARPVWADASGDIGSNRVIYEVSSAVPSALLFAQSGSRTWASQVSTAGISSTQVAAIPAGATLSVSSQYKSFAAGPQVALDTGSGLSSFATAASAVPVFGNQTLRIGSKPGAELFGVLLDLKARAGLITLAAMQTEPSFAPANPLEVTDFEVPGPLISKAQSGRVNLRSTQQIGRIWTEHYLLKVTDAASKEFLARMSTYWRNGTIFAKGHVDYAVCKGVGGGVPLVMGASQTGSTLIVDGCPASTAGWLLAGDLFRVQGLPQALMCAADVNTEGTGRALIPLVIPIFTGGSPSDNASLTITGVTLDVCLLEAPTFPTTTGGGADYGELVLKFSEAL